MTSDTRILSSIRIAGQPVMLEPHNCFACGTLNAGGLQLELHAGDDVCWTELSLDKRFEGWDGIAHGGIICTILDEVMGWAVIEHDLWGVTARMAVDFKKPVVIGQPIRAEARVTSARRRVVDVEGELRHADGTLLAAATATYVAAPEAKKAELKARYGLAPAAAGAPR